MFLPTSKLKLLLKGLHVAFAYYKQLLVFMHTAHYRGGAKAWVEATSAKECRQLLTGKQFAIPKYGKSALV